jgi:BirA family biotin operon repressor/biotin-[acetyl-CoA-carboxylase] ligase
VSRRVNAQLVACLSATESRSGEAIARALGCSRTAVWKHIGELRDLGIDVQAVAGQGYRLAEPLELLERERILAALSNDTRGVLADLLLLPEVDSTNAELQRMVPGEQHAIAILAERQTAGRGRRGRSWYSPFARNLYLSLGWRFEAGAAELGCLPLVVSLAVHRALTASGLQGHFIKWPNDLVMGGRKLGGCLVELQGDASGPCTAVMGVGVNVNMPRSAAADAAIDQPWTDVGSSIGEVSRNDLAAILLEELVAAAATYGTTGFAPFQAEWAACDGLAGKPVSLVHGREQVSGVARGISERGGLRVEAPGGVLEFLSGEVQLRGAPG